MRSQLGEVAPIFLQCLVLSLRILVGHPLRAANGGQRLQYVLTREPCLSQHMRHLSISDIEHGQQQVLHAQVLIMEGAHLAPGIFQQLAQARRNARLTATIDMRHALEFVVEDAPCCCEITADLRNHLLHYSTFLGKQGSKQVLDLDLIMMVLPG